MADWNTGFLLLAFQLNKNNGLFYLCVLGPQLVEDVGGVEASVVTQLSGDDLQSLGVGANQKLLLARNGSGIIPQVLGQLHLNGPSTSDHGVILKPQIALLHSKAVVRFDH